MERIDGAEQRVAALVQTVRACAAEGCDPHLVTALGAWVAEEVSDLLRAAWEDGLAVGQHPSRG